MAQAENIPLRHHPSPYVSMHADDSVQWRTWEKKTLLEAQRRNKPLLLSIGYFSCYWCHVMQQENFRQPRTAALINEHFVPVIIDREMQPALDGYMSRFVEELIGYSGWPLHVILTPEGYPFLGAVYLPNDRFHNWLAGIRDAWAEQHEALSQAARETAQSQQFRFSPRQGKLTRQLGKRASQAFMEAVRRNMDDIEGGFGQQSKFPLPAILGALLRQQNLPDDLRHFLQLTLDTMAGSALHDPLQGGFFRYTSDPSWEIPHFEKMLYDNALLAQLYLQAGEQWQEPTYKQLGRQTLRFIEQHMSDDQPGFFSSLSATDESGEEGRYYLWQIERFGAPLSDTAWQRLRQAWQLPPAPLMEGGYLFGHMPEPAELQDSWRTLRQHLLKRQKQRDLPKDRKKLAAWNALALLAFTEAARQGDARSKKSAARLAGFLSALWDGKRLSRSLIAGKPQGQAFLEDYAYGANALYAYGSLMRDEHSVQLAKQLARRAWDLFFTPQGWRASHNDLIPVSMNEVMMADGPRPSPSASLIEVSLQSGDRALQQKAHTALQRGHSLLRRSPFWYASHVLLVREGLAVR